MAVSIGFPSKVCRPKYGPAARRAAVLDRVALVEAGAQPEAEVLTVRAAGRTYGTGDEQRQRWQALGLVVHGPECAACYPRGRAGSGLAGAGEHRLDWAEASAIL